MQPTPWLIRQPSPARRLRLFCFPYSGGNAVSFAAWQRELDPAIEVCAVQFPGRGARFREKPYSSFSSLIEALGEVIRQQEDGLPFVFFGHSLGSLVAFELVRYCRQHGLPMPLHLFASGCNSPPFKSKARSRRLHELPDDELIEALRDYNGTPQEILDNRELMSLVLPAIRADFALGADYVYQPGPPLDIPITVLTGKLDKHVQAEGLKGWQDETRRDFLVHYFEGDHFFIGSERNSVLDCLGAEMKKYYQPVAALTNSSH